MEICNDRRHGEIVHDQGRGDCPACKELDEQAEIIKELEQDLAKAEQTISEWKEQA
jgi:hypothetical protein